MRLVHRENDGLHEWINSNSGLIVAVGGDADHLAELFDRGDIHWSWRLFGSPDQQAGICVAARPEYADAHWLQGLETATCRMLPSDTVGWLPMSMDDLREHTCWSGPEAAGRTGRIGQLDVAAALADAARAEDAARRQNAAPKPDPEVPAPSSRCP